MQVHAAVMRSARSACRVAVVVAALALAACAPGGPKFESTDITGAGFGREFSLTDATGKTRTLDDFRGKAVVVFFGFTQCPDVCPASLATLAEARRKLGADGERVQGVFITVDPERDTPALLKSYMAGFDPSFVALRGTPEQTQAVAKEFKVFYAKVPGKEPGSYTMDHSAGSYVFDTNGRIRLFERYQTPPQALAEDLKRLL
jgi:protein SCO1/2